LSSPSFLSVTSRLPRIFSNGALLADVSGVSMPASRISRPSISTNVRPSSTARTVPASTFCSLQSVSCAAAVLIAATVSITANSNLHIGFAWARG
jgi:hypothetical protein